MTKKTYIAPVLMDDLSADDEVIDAGQFESATTTVVRTIGREFNIDVVFSGNSCQAATDGKTVVLPAQDPTKSMTKRQYSVGQGFANHETMHNLCTDIGIWKRESERLSAAGRKLAIAAAQAIEDMRIERAAAKLYPGIPAQIASTTDYVAKHFLDNCYANEPSVIKDMRIIGPVAITWIGRKRLGYNSPYNDKCISLLDPKHVETINKWIDLIDRLPHGATAPGIFDRSVAKAGTADTFRLAEMFSNEINNEAQAQGQGQGQGQAQGQGQGQGQGQNKDQNNNAPDGQNNGSSGDSSAGQSQTSSRSGNAGISQAHEPAPIDPELNAAVSALLNEGNGRDAWRSVSTALDITIDKNTAIHPHHSGRTFQNPITNPDNLACYQNIVSNIGGRVAVMRRKIERAIMTASATDYESGHRQGKLDVTRKAARIMQGYENVHRKKVDGADFDTSVTILVDASSSMNETSKASTLKKSYVATEVCIALAEALDKTPVELEIIAFNSRHFPELVSKEACDAYLNAVRAAAATPKEHLRQNFFRKNAPAVLYVLKAADERLREARKAIGAIFSALPHGSTPDGHCILRTAARLHASKRKRKILLVLTDGNPTFECVPGNTAKGRTPQKFLEKALEKVEREGIETIGIGILTDHVKHYYKNHAVVQNLEDLDKTVMDKLAKALLGEKFKVDNGDLLVTDVYKKGGQK